MADDLAARAFNAGADARLAGWPRGYNPYDRLAESALYQAWRRGWLHTDAHWGCDARLYPKWPVRPLPAVKGLFRDRLAWKVTLFMGLQSAMAYIVFGWMAPMLRDRGMAQTVDLLEAYLRAAGVSADRDVLELDHAFAALIGQGGRYCFRHARCRSRAGELLERVAVSPRQRRKEANCLAIARGIGPGARALWRASRVGGAHRNRRRAQGMLVAWGVNIAVVSS